MKEALQSLSAHYPWVLSLLAAIGTIRVALKPFSARIQTRLAQKMAEAAVSQDEEEGRDWDAVLSARWYRITAFVLDLVCSFKLPTRADFLAERVRRS